MALSDQDKREIQEQISQGFDKLLEYQGLDFNKHSEHHTFICALRKRVQTAWKAAIWTIVGVMTAGVLGLIWQAISKGGI